MSQGHILYLSYYWPPCGGPSVQRSLKFVKYLTRLGYDIHVVTVDLADASYPFLDDGFLHDIPEQISISRTKARNPLKLYARIFPKHKQTVGFADEGKKSWASTLIRFIRGNFFIPDPRKGWNSFAWREVRRIHNRTPFDCVITSTPPHSTNLLGIKIKKKLNIPWIADLRDPWTDIYYYPQLLRTKLALLLDRKYERKTLMKTDAIVTVSHSIKQTLINKVHGIDPRKFHVIYNGYDPEDFLAIKPLDEKETGYTIAYAGVMAPNYGLQTLIKAWQMAFDSGNPGINLKLIGHASENVLDQLKKTIGEKNLILTGYLSHNEALRHMASADALLLMIPQTADNKGILTGKLFEYLACQKPIIGIGPEDGEAAAIIREQNAGEMVGYEGYRRLSALFKQYTSKNDQLILNSEKYSREKQTNWLSDVIKHSINSD